MDHILQKIHQSALKFLMPLNLEQTYRMILEEAMKLVKAEFGSILLEEDGQLKRVYASHAEFYSIKPRSKDIMHKVYKTQKPIILRLKQLKGIAKIHPQIQEIGINSDIIVALSYQNKPIGVITLMSRKEDYFTEKEVAILQLFAPLASLAIRKTQLDETKTLTGNILDKVYKAGLKFLIPLTPEETYKLIIEEAIKLVKADYGHMTLDQGGQLVRVYVSDPIIHKIKPRKVGNLYQVIHTRKPMIISYNEVKDVHPVIKEMGVKSIIGIPLFYRNKSIGMMGLQSLKDNYFTQKEIELLQFFASLASLAIRKTQLYDETKKALDTRDLFISMAAHEFRTPLTTINGYIQLLHSKLSGADTSESRWVQELSWEASRLTQLVNELLAVERIKIGQFHYSWKECSLGGIVNRALKDFRFTHPDHKVIFENKIKDNKDQIIGDYDKILQVIINILDNAAKFSNSESEINITLSYKTGHLILNISDQGSGINKKDMEQIFNKYYTGSHPTREGMGLGLFLVKHIINQHHGSIQVKSKENKGTIITIQLPRIKDG